VSTVYLRIARVDWPAISTGTKTEYRAAGRYALLTAQLNLPIPVVGYTLWDHQPPSARLLVLEHGGLERLGAISEESLAREGFWTGDRRESYSAFRRYWKGRHNGEFKPVSQVWAYRLRPFTEADVDEHARRLFDHLYGAHAPW
jgi:hypothetical protein